MSVTRRRTDDLLGKGTYGKVFPTTFQDTLGCVKKGAVKVMYYDCPMSGFGNIREIEILSRLSNSNFIPEIYFANLADYVYRPKGDGERRKEFISLIYEIADMDALGYIRGNYGDLRTYFRLFSEMVMAVDHMHARKICHRDLKPANILIFISPSGEPKAKVCDFGFATFMTKNSTRSPRAYSPWYRPPELKWGVDDYKFSADVWALGCIFYEMLSGGKILLKDTGDEDSGISKFFEECLKAIPNEWTVETQKLYRKHSSHPQTKVFGNSSIRKIPKHKESFMPHFSKMSRYGPDDEELLNAADNILKKCLDFNYHERVTTSKLLKDSGFNFIRNYIDTSLKKQSKPQCYDPIFIRIPEAINEKKVSYFEEALERFSNLPMKQFFNAVDLANCFLTAYPNTVLELDNIFASCLYFFNKYLSILVYPEEPQVFFFRTYTAGGNEISDEDHRKMDKFIFDFEAIVVDPTQLLGIRVYRPTIIDMQDHFDHSLSDNKLKTLFLEFCRIDSWNEKSFRYMYRYLYNKLFDSDFPVD